MLWFSTNSHGIWWYSICNLEHLLAHRKYQNYCADAKDLVNSASTVIPFHSTDMFLSFVRKKQINYNYSWQMYTKICKIIIAIFDILKEGNTP